MTDRELLMRITAKDFEITAIRGSGPGGQHRNKVSSGQRFKHKASGAVGEATDDRSQLANKQQAFKRCVATKEFQAWFRIAVAEAQGRPSTESLVTVAMKPGNIDTQILVDDRWVTIDPSLLEGDES